MAKRAIAGARALGHGIVPLLGTVLAAASLTVATITVV